MPKLNAANPVLDILNSNNVGGGSNSSGDDNANKGKKEDADGNGVHSAKEEVEAVQLRNKKLSCENRPGSLVDRLSKLQMAQNNWQVRRQSWLYKFKLQLQDFII